MNPSRSRMLTALSAWVAGAATAVAVGLYALSSIDFGLTDRSVSQPLGEFSAPNAPDASESSAATPETSATGATDPSNRTPSSSAGAQPIGVERTISSAGGTVVARCTPDGAYLVSWSPAQGFHSEDVQRGPGPLASVKFEGLAAEYLTTVTCVKGVPQGKVSTDH